MKAWSAMVLAAVLLLTACGQEPDHQQAPLPVPLDVVFEMTPAAPQPGEQVAFSVTVKQGGEPVDDAEEVRFELWRDGQETHEFLDAVNKGGGLYTAEKQLPDAGTYHLTYHVTARGFHSMDTLQFAVGQTTDGQASEQPVDDAGEGSEPVNGEQHHEHSGPHAEQSAEVADE